MVSVLIKTGVICRRCQKPIVVENVADTSVEFSVRCPSCGHREFYRIKDLKTLERPDPRQRLGWRCFSLSTAIHKRR